MQATVPSVGAYTLPSVGIIAIPSPISLSEKVVSGTLVKSSISPDIGDFISNLSTNGFTSFFLCL